MQNTFAKFTSSPFQLVSVTSFMKNLLTFLVATILSLTAAAQTKEYVCLPCGHDCDKTIYNKPGTCASCHMKLVERKSVQFKNLTADEFCERILANPDAVILDVRSESEFKGKGLSSTYGHFKNAININIKELKERIGELEKYKDSEVLVYCSHSIRSPQASMLLIESGFQNVSNMTGGVSTISDLNNDCLKKNYIVHK
jgi:rhodanese-related sulfurtransferase